MARKTTKAIIPGSMEAVYDLRRGLLHELHLNPDGCVTQPDAAQAVLLERLGIALPKRLRIPAIDLPAVLSA